MIYIKLFEEFDFTCYKKYKVGDFVYIMGNDDPAEIIDVNYEDRFEHYLCYWANRDVEENEDIGLPIENWYNERYIIRKLEDWELEALKYNL